jgi:hypothetical protein
MLSTGLHFALESTGCAPGCRCPPSDRAHAAGAPQQADAGHDPALGRCPCRQAPTTVIGLQVGGRGHKLRHFRFDRPGQNRAHHEERRSAETPESTTSSSDMVSRSLREESHQTKLVNTTLGRSNSNATSQRRPRGKSALSSSVRTSVKRPRLSSGATTRATPKSKNRPTEANAAL